jgi:hypothetical protein
VPVFLAMTKFDLLSGADDALVQNNINYYHPDSYIFHRNGDFGLDPLSADEEVLWRRVHCYESKINPNNDKAEVPERDVARDAELLKLFKDIIDYSLSKEGKRRCSSSSSKLLNIAKSTLGHKLLTRRTRQISI